jgi:hypothetical protein
MFNHITSDKAIELIKAKFEGINSSRQIPLMSKNRYFTATLKENGIEVDNLSTQKLLPWSVFKETIHLLAKDTARKGVVKGNAMNGKLGDKRLPLHSIEGHLAITLFDKKEGHSVFRRITPVSGILTWASLCDNGKRGYLRLV